MLRQRTYLAKSVNISNENAFSIRSMNATSEFSGTITIERLATQANWQSVELKKGLNEDATIEELGITVPSSI